jgi:hypothetical protein
MYISEFIKRYFIYREGQKSPIWKLWVCRDVFHELFDEAAARFVH